MFLTTTEQFNNCNLAYLFWKFLQKFKHQTSVITTVSPHTYIYFIFNGTTERFLNQGFKLKLWIN